MKKVVQNEKGLTLVELLATLVILAIIATIAVLSIGQIIKNSEQRAIVADALRAIEATKIAIANGDESKTEKLNITYDRYYEYDEIQPYFSLSEEEAIERIGWFRIHVKKDEEGNEQYIFGRRGSPTGLLYKIPETSKYKPVEDSKIGKDLYTEEALKDALEGKGKGSK